jgi:Head domain of trimeric autotransporter adhesin
MFDRRPPAMRAMAVHCGSRAFASGDRSIAIGDGAPRHSRDAFSRDQDSGKIHGICPGHRNGILRLAMPGSAQAFHRLRKSELLAAESSYEAPPAHFATTSRNTTP